MPTTSAQNLTVARGRGGKRPRTSATTRRRSSRLSETITVDLCTPNGCIDLTVEADDEEVVAFTSYDDGIVCLGPVTPESQRAQSRGRGSRRGSSCTSIACGPSRLPLMPNEKRADNKLPVPSIQINDSEEHFEGLNARKEIMCPVCFEDTSTMPETNKQLMSTVCGHLFCNVCIDTAVRNGHKCPTCRKKLTLKQFHPIFL